MEVVFGMHCLAKMAIENTASLLLSSRLLSSDSSRPGVYSMDWRRIVSNGFLFSYVSVHLHELGSLSQIHRDSTQNPPRSTKIQAFLTSPPPKALAGLQTSLLSPPSPPGLTLEPPGPSQIPPRNPRLPRRGNLAVQGYRERVVRPFWTTQNG